MIKYLQSLQYGEAYVYALFLLIAAFMVVSLQGIIGYCTAKSNLGKGGLAACIAVLLLSTIMLLFCLHAFIV